MPPKPAPPAIDLNANHEHSIELETKVRDLIHRQQLKAAVRVFTQEWEQAVLPHLPLRQSFELDRLDKRGISKLVELTASGQEVQFELNQGIDPRNQERIGVLIKGQDELVGFLPTAAEELLSRADDHADMYELKALALEGFSTGTPSMLMELVRPDLRQCEFCTELHAGASDKCDECRARRKRKRAAGMENQLERPSVPLAGAFRDLIIETKVV